MTVRPTTKIPIPIFSNMQEEAAFWDTHDFTEVESKPVDATFAKNLSTIVSVRFEADTLSKIDKQASQKGLGTATLIRMWIMERLNQIYPVTP